MRAGGTTQLGRVRESQRTRHFTLKEREGPVTPRAVGEKTLESSGNGVNRGVEGRKESGAEAGEVGTNRPVPGHAGPCKEPVHYPPKDGRPKKGFMQEREFLCFVLLTDHYGE